MRLLGISFGLLGATFSLPASAMDLRIGQSYFEQGDYLLHPGVQVAASTNTGLVSRLAFTGRKFGPFTEATAILSFNHTFHLLPWKSVTTDAGISVLDEYTSYDKPRGKDESIHAMNLGVNFAIAWTVIETDRWNARLEWDSHIFAAGLAFLYLTTARKTVFTAGVGYQI